MGLFDFFKKKQTEEVQDANLLSTKVKVTTYSTNDDGELNFSVAGTKFRTLDEIERIKELQYAEELKLIPEPTNPYDPNAIAIYTKDDSLVGYVPKAIVSENDLDKPDFKVVVTKVTDDEPPFVNVRYMKR